MSTLALLISGWVGGFAWGWLVGTWRANHKRTIVTIPQDQAFTVMPRTTNSDAPGGYGATMDAAPTTESQEERWPTD